MSAAAQEYAVVPGAAAADRERAVAIWAASDFGDPSLERQRARYDWFYRQSPGGEAQVSFLHAPAESAPVGFLGVGFREWSVDGQAARGGVLVDFVVHATHRKAAPALQLQRQGRERAFATASFLIGLPEPKAVAIFKRLGSEASTVLPRYVRVLRHAGYLKRRLPGWCAAPLGICIDAVDAALLRLRLVFGGLRHEWRDDFDADFDELWQRCGKQGRCIGVRDRRFLSWRFTSQPNHRYRILRVSPKSGGGLQMYFVCEHDGDTLVIKDYLGTGDARELAEGWAHLAVAARRERVSAITIQLLADDEHIAPLRAMRFVARDSRPFFAMIRGREGDRPLAKHWYVSQADEDN